MSEHFTLVELTKSKFAEAAGGNEPNEAQVKSLNILADTLLEPIRAMLNTPLIVTSGFRNPTVNMLAHGEQKSAHLDGRACDFIPVGVGLDLSFAAIVGSPLPYDKVILEQKGLIKWIHIQIAKEGNAPRRKAYTAIVDPVTHEAHYEEV